MLVKGRRVYRGHRAASTRAPAIILFVVVLLLLVFLLSFSLLPQYLVYYRDGVNMVVPMLQDSGEGYKLTAATPPQPYPGIVSADYQVAQPDYSTLDFGAGAGLHYLQGYFVPYNKVSESGLETAVKEAQRSSVKGLVLEMKDENGKLAWLSGVAAAASYGVNGSWDPSAELAELKAQGWFLAAELSCAVDTSLATGFPELALKDMTGKPYTDGAGSWVDPWSRDVRSYISQLCEDLISLGFDEIILTHVEHPLAEVGYTRQIGSSLDRTACTMNFAISVRQSIEPSMKKSGVRLSAELSRDTLTNTAANGQSLENMLKVFDRVVLPTTTYSEDAKIFVENHIDSTVRFVPQMSWCFSGGSWILDPSITD